MIILDERGKQCPLPVIEAKKALEGAAQGEVVAVTVDNEIAVQNLQKMAAHKGFNAVLSKAGDREFTLEITVGNDGKQNLSSSDQKKKDTETLGAGQEIKAADSHGQGTVVVLSSKCMGDGEEELGRTLMKGFIYALTQQDALPAVVLLYNTGAYLSCEGSDSLEDLLFLESQGVEILTCGTCMNYYGLSDNLKVGSVTNMYEIVEKQTGAALIIRP